MAPYYPLYIRRSDGKLEVQGSKKLKERNEPLAEQLNTAPNAQGISDFYRLCLTGETKEVDWRRKLGGMLMREIGEKEPKDRNFILANLPENYRLYEHVKCTFAEIDGKPQNPKKNHAGGGNERQDAYLYGHPQGRKKRYRSPAEFFPHLLWLATDENGDNNNCTCKFCSPEEIEMPIESVATKSPAIPIRQDSAVRPQQAPVSSVVKAAPIVAAPARQQSLQPTKPQALLVPTPLPRYRSMEQKEDAKFNNFFFRPGEIVWFDKGEETWGIGVILRREHGPAQDTSKQYRVHPISHPFARHHALVTTHKGMRPFFSWSPPPYTNNGLKPSQSNGYHVYTFDTVNWEDVMRGKYGTQVDKGDADVDGSIMGVKAVETTYTLFDRIPGTLSSLPGAIGYNGIYIGCEKIWVGEPLRIRNSTSPTDIMVIQSIIERPSAKDPSHGLVTIIGDTYSYRIAQVEPQFVPGDDLHLPLRVREDTRLRNNITVSNPDVRRRITCYWRLIAKNAQIGLSDVKGRWYETTSMFPHLNKAGYDAAVARHEMPDVGSVLNGTGDCNKELLDVAGVASQARTHVPPFLKAVRREDAVRNMLPSSARISRGLDESREEALPVRESKIPVASTAVKTEPAFTAHAQSNVKEEPTPQQPQVPPLTDGAFEQYMTFDGGEAPSAFEQQFDQTFYDGGADTMQG